MTLLKLIGGVVALAVAFVFVFVLPGAGFENLVVDILASLAGVFGLTSWRQTYGLLKEWYQSKTIVSALVVAVGLIALGVISFFSLGVPAWIITIITGLVTAFGGGTIIGIFDAVMKAKKNPNSY